MVEREETNVQGKQRKSEMTGEEAGRKAIETPREERGPKVEEMSRKGGEVRKELGPESYSELEPKGAKKGQEFEEGKQGQNE